MSKKIYVCEFIFTRFRSDMQLEVSSDRGIHVFVGGFWINENLNYTNGSDAKYYIPDSKINCIRKEET